MADGNFDSRNQFQADVTKAVTDHFRTHDRAQVISPCGTGKTRITGLIYSALKPNRALVMTPSLLLTRDAGVKWKEYGFLHGIRALFVGSAKNHVPGAASVDMDEANIRWTSSPSEIAAFLAEEGPAIVFCCYQSSELLAGRNFDLAVFDEAHRTVSTKQKEKCFQFALHNKNVNIAKRLFVTATDKTIRIKKGDEEEVVGMSDEKVYGEVVTRLPFKQAVADGYIVPNEVRIFQITEVEVANLFRRTVGLFPDAILPSALIDLKPKKTVKEGDAREVAEGNSLYAAALAESHKAVGIHHTLCFTQLVKGAEAFAAELNALAQADDAFKGLVAFWIDGDQNREKSTTLAEDGTRYLSITEEKIQQFRKAKRAVLVSARALQEGIDIPVVDSIMFVDPRSSVIDIVQAIGRAARTTTGKQKSYVLMPVSVDFTSPEKIEETLDRSAFVQVRNVLRALELGEALVDTDLVQLVSTGSGPRQKQDEAKVMSVLEQETKSGGIRLSPGVVLTHTHRAAGDLVKTGLVGAVGEVGKKLRSMVLDVVQPRREQSLVELIEVIEEWRAATGLTRRPRQKGDRLERAAFKAEKKIHQKDD